MLKLVIARFRDDTGEMDTVLLESAHLHSAILDAMQNKRYLRRSSASRHAQQVLADLEEQIRIDTASLT